MVKVTKIDTNNLSHGQRQQRMNVRNFLLVATLPELRKELDISMDTKQLFRALCILELIGELDD